MNYYAAVHAFLLTSELGSFSVAARRLSIKASTVSHYISGLENELGGALFSRSTRGVVLTERGMTFRGLAQGAVDKLDEARAAVSIFRDTRADAVFHRQQRN
ncbi:LysR family transcriptional regulator [Burkholderia pseudomultivorans]|uniref:HTH-type transcriptional regulator DsdC n=1 Tax=Burkholderia pseudomultivorans TaxID=1207504 RepID=A0ABU2EE64_9BURK|nr:LysR family transcriptional regulator [Burkholderia pseudomultivorans]MDR8731724.1 HTH-type transcriptional regulator DsdC [Burkholderia pseudomultivorans]MDR8739061.1 HTH-type transcriptional regulator DsdC [Burkholderia pseudomultivorans]MDR8745627.1 HTH-type transcriptional regulator DsdC [Burkholderia pseudomultivorans]MDR8757921.1 HTH-type transcriptional regulator DsdC [Burkholderia pseudomultivorans]MDR8781964.1 HTH-type transcriptional regulator DsdC [Burkholderia pseudomultivorans]